MKSRWAHFSLCHIQNKIIFLLFPCHGHNSEAFILLLSFCLHCILTRSVMYMAMLLHIHLQCILFTWILACMQPLWWSQTQHLLCCAAYSTLTHSPSNSITHSFDVHWKDIFHILLSPFNHITFFFTFDKTYYKITMFSFSKIELLTCTLL